MKITAELVDRVMREDFSGAEYTELNRLTTLEVKQAVGDSEEVTAALVELLARNYPAEVEFSSALVMGVNIGMALQRRLSAEEIKQ